MNPLSTRAPRLTWLAAAFVTTFCALVASVGADAHWLAALGGDIVRLGEVPAGVPYAAAPSAGWENVPVLGELIFHWLEAGLGDQGLLLAQAAAVAFALSFLSWDMRRGDAADAPAALVLLLVAVAAAPALLVIRGQLFSLALFPLLLVLLRNEARVPSLAIWLVPPLFALWSNLHGGVLVGAAVACAYLLLNRLQRRPLAAIGVLITAGAALLLTPALLQTDDYYRGVLGSVAAKSREAMWAPLSLDRPFDVAFLAAGLPVVIAALLARPRLWELAALAGLGAMTFESGRNGIWLVFFAATPAARWVTGARAWKIRPPRSLTALAAGSLVVMLSIGLAKQPSLRSADTQLRQRAATTAAGTPILADDLNAEALALDGQRVWIANPLDAFRREDQRLYLDWTAGRASGDALLERVRVALVTADSSPERRLERAAGWRERAHDAHAVLFVRTTPAA